MGKNEISTFSPEFYLFLFFFFFFSKRGNRSYSVDSVKNKKIYLLKDEILHECVVVYEILIHFELKI